MSLETTLNNFQRKTKLLQIEVGHESYDQNKIILPVALGFSLFS